MFDAKKVKDEIILWIQNYFKENGEGCKAVVGISGGKDSSVVAALCAEALGKERVFAVLMPKGEQYDIDISYALIKHLGLAYQSVNIESIMNSTLAAFEAESFNITEQAKYNIPPRIRMTILYAISATINARVANTSNLSEDWVGWATKFGDAAGDFSPLSNLTVTEVLAIGRELELPDMFLSKVPEDGLTGRSDEENFGFTYAALDKYIREGICEDEKLKEKIDDLHRNNVHKVRPLPCFVLNI